VHKEEKLNISEELLNTLYESADNSKFLFIFVFRAKKVEKSSESWLIFWLLY
jgi:hypothetical protein